MKWCDQYRPFSFVFQRCLLRFCFSFKRRLISNNLPISLSRFPTGSVYLLTHILSTYFLHFISPADSRLWQKEERNEQMVSKWENKNFLLNLILSTSVVLLLLCHLSDSHLFSHLSPHAFVHAFHLAVLEDKLFCRPVLLHCLACSVGGLLNPGLAYKI